MELISAQIMTKCGETQKIVAYVPPKNKNWTKDEHAKLKDTLESLEKIIRNSKRIIIVGDFNCGEVM